MPADSSIEVPITVTRVAPQSLSISDGGTTFTANVVVPNPVGQDTASTVYVDYTNTGNVAIPAPLLMLTATQGSSQGGFLSLESSLAGLAYNSNETPSGFNNAVELLASGATPGMLEPGETEQIPVYYGWMALVAVELVGAGHLQSFGGGCDRHRRRRLAECVARSSARFHQRRRLERHRSDRGAEYGLDLGPIRPDARQRLCLSRKRRRSDDRRQPTALLRGRKGQCRLLRTDAHFGGRR